MSIIQEALKKAQYNYTSKKGLPQTREEPEQKPKISAPTKAPAGRAITKRIAIIVYVIALLALATGFGIRMLFSKIVTVDNKVRPENLTPAAQKTDPDKAAPSSFFSEVVERAMKRPSASIHSGSANQSPDLVLNGIMYIEGNPKAIINGTVVREGDAISGAVVTSISENNVLLKYNNNDNQVEVALKLKE